MHKHICTLKSAAIIFKHLNQPIKLSLVQRATRKITKVGHFSDNPGQIFWKIAFSHLSKQQSPLPPNQCCGSRLRIRETNFTTFIWGEGEICFFLTIFFLKSFCPGLYENNNKLQCTKTEVHFFYIGKFGRAAALRFA